MCVAIVYSTNQISKQRFAILTSSLPGVAGRVRGERAARGELVIPQPGRQRLIAHAWCGNVRVICLLVKNTQHLLALTLRRKGTLNFEKFLVIINV